MKPEVWAQLKNVTADELVRALESDGWSFRSGRGARRIYLKGTNLVSIHYHPKKAYGRDLLRDLLEDIAWDEEENKEGRHKAAPPSTLTDFYVLGYPVYPLSVPPSLP